MLKTKMIEMVCILDKSGSMYEKEKDTIASYNHMLEKQKEKEGEAYITTALFSDTCKILCSHAPLCQADALTEKNYYAEGNTALFDAIGKVFCQVEQVLEQYEKDREKKVFVFIITDGLENASTEYDQAKICQLIDEKQERGWEILFLGANRSVVRMAQMWGIKKENTIEYTNDSRGITKSYELAGRRFTRMREM